MSTTGITNKQLTDADMDFEDVVCNQGNTRQKRALVRQERNALISIREGAIQQFMAEGMTHQEATDAVEGFALNYTGRAS